MAFAERLYSNEWATPKDRDGPILTGRVLRTVFDEF